LTDFISWNVLDAECMGWVIERNSQGISRSMIADEHVYIGDSKLTIRDKHIVALVLEMLSHPTHPRSMLSLQECSTAFNEELRSRLPAHITVLASHGETIILDTRRFEMIEAKEISGLFTGAPYRKVQEVTVRRPDNGQVLRLINTHLPGDPQAPARYELAEYLKSTFDPAMTTIAMGDMNFNELEMADAMEKAFDKNSPFSIHSPYCTNISPNVFNSKAIDHFLVYSPDGSVKLNSPDQIMQELDPIVSLLQSTTISTSR